MAIDIRYANNRYASVPWLGPFLLFAPCVRMSPLEMQKASAVARQNDSELWRDGASKQLCCEGGQRQKMQKQILLATALVLAGSLVHATQAPQAPPAAPAPQAPTAAPTPKPEEGIPITDQTVLKACGTCHRPDDKSQMSRISFQRNTPEGWQNTIQRMMALNGLKMDPAVGRE